MRVHDHESAMEWCMDWLRPGPHHRALPGSNVRRFAECAAEMRVLARLEYNHGREESAARFIEAAEVIERAALWDAARALAGDR